MRKLCTCYVCVYVCEYHFLSFLLMAQLAVSLLDLTMDETCVP